MRLFLQSFDFWISDIGVTIECGSILKWVRYIITAKTHLHRTDKYLQYRSIIWPFWLNDCLLVHELTGCRFEPGCSHLNFGNCACLIKYFLDIFATAECECTLKRVRDMICTYSQIYHPGKYLLVGVLLELLNFQISHLFWAKSFLTFR